MRRHIDAETPLSPDPQQVSLEQVLNTLLPIRRRRLRHCEREQRQHEQHLRRCQQAVELGEQQLAEQKIGYLQLRNDFVPQHAGVTQPLNDLRETLDVEKTTRAGVIQQIQRTQQLQEEVQQQQARLNDAQLAVQRCQRDIEKMEYLLNQNQGNAL
jgi:multidrug resistance efflux pump